MRHVADEMRRVGLLHHDFGPLVPFGRPLMLEEEIDKRMGAFPLAQLHERSSDAPFVRSVDVPQSVAVAALDKAVPVLVERPANFRLE